MQPIKKLLPVLVLLLFIPFSTFASLVGDRTTPVEVTQLSGNLKRMYALDKHVALFDIDYSFAGKDVMLRDVTISVKTKAALLQGPAKTDYRIMDCIQALPDAKGLEGRTYGTINVSVTNLRAVPDFPSEITMQGLMGMSVHVLQRGGWIHIQVPDNYIAQVHYVDVHLASEVEMVVWNNAEKIVVIAHYGSVYSKLDRTSQTVPNMMADNRFKWDGSKGTLYKVIYPDGRQGYASRSTAMPGKKWRSGLKQDVADIIRTTRTMIGILYLWVGTSSKGVGCSGFVRTILLMHDIITPRDAFQQAYVSRRIGIASDLSNLRSGDPVLSGRKATVEHKERVVYVGVYIGGKRFIHSQGDVHISSFDSLDELFDECNLGRLLLATRVLPYINKKIRLNATTANEYYE